jgi:hypothetical protein
MPGMTGDLALAYLRERGIVLESARGPLPRLVEAIAGAPIEGSWWSHPHARRIYAALQVVTSADEVFVCRLVDDKITLVHERLLPALVRLADDFPKQRLARIRQIHTLSSRHVNELTPYPEWVTPQLRATAAQLTRERARQMLPIPTSEIGRLSSR